MNVDDPIARGVALYAAIVSTAALAWNIYIGWRDAARVQMHLRGAIVPLPSGDAGEYLAFEVVNHGRRPVTICQYGFIAGKSVSQPLPWADKQMPPQLRDASKLPVELAEGQRATFFCRPDALTTLARERKVKAYVQDARSRNYYHLVSRSLTSRAGVAPSVRPWWQLWRWRA